MTVLVTGGAGYIGSHTVRLLRERGRSVVVLDSLEQGHRAAALDTPLVVGDIGDSELVAKLVAEHEVDSCIHFAAYKAAGESMEQPARYFSNNVAKTSVLLDTLRSAGVNHVVFSSSCAVYGTPDTTPVAEDAPVHPESPYGETKLMVEQMLRWYDRCHGLRSVALRYFNAAGAWPDGSIGEDWTYVQNLVPLVMKAAFGRAVLKVYGTDYATPDGTCIRDYIHVVDLADAHVRALDYLARGGSSDALNVGTGTGSSVKHVIDVARRVTGRDIPAEDVARRAGDPVAVFADNQKAAAVLGWAPQYGITEIIDSAWRWHSSHPDGYGA